MWQTSPSSYNVPASIQAVNVTSPHLQQQSPQYVPYACAYSPQIQIASSAENEESDSYALQSFKAVHRSRPLSPPPGLAHAHIKAYAQAQAQKQAQILAQHQAQAQALAQQQAQAQALAQQEAHALAQALAQQQAQTQALTQQQAWSSYPAQVTPESNYYYWYGLNQNSNGLGAQSHYQTQPNQNGLSGGTESLPTNSNQTTRPSAGFGPDLVTSGGVLNRIDSVSSFRNQQGLRIRDSERDMMTYHRIAERKRKSKSFGEVQSRRERQQPPPPSPQQQQKLDEEEYQEKNKPTEMRRMRLTQSQPMIRENLDSNLANHNIVNEEDLNTRGSPFFRNRESNLVNHNIVIEEDLNTRGSRFFRKLGLFRKEKKQAALEYAWENRDVLVNMDSRRLPHKKPNFLKRLFGGMHYPTHQKGLKGQSVISLPEITVKPLR